MHAGELTLDVLWRDVTARLQPGSIIPTLKGRASAVVVSVEPEMMKIRLDKGEIREIKKDYFAKALDRLRKQGPVRQKYLSGGTERYVLGVLKSLPYFEVVDMNGTQFVRLKG